MRSWRHFAPTSAGSRSHPTSFLAELERVARPIHIRLRRFNHGEVTEQIAAIRGPLNVQPGLVDDILARSEGNPFFTEELLAAPASDASIPANLDEVLRVRLGALSEPARHIVGAAAVRSNKSTEEELSAVTRLEGSRSRPRVARAARSKDLRTPRSWRPRGTHVQTRSAEVCGLPRAPGQRATEVASGVRRSAFGQRGEQRRPLRAGGDCSASGSRG